MPDTSVKRIHESMRGAPVLNGVAGSLIGLLDTFLVNGWGLATANSLSVSGGVATLTMPAGSGFEDHCVVLIAGATPAALNGEQRIATTNGTTLTFPTTAADGPATGTITVKYAPCGWQKVFSGANLAVYRSQNVMGNRRFLRVADTGNVDARVVAYNNMTAVSTGTGPFPTAAQISGGGYWPKSMSADTTAQRYDLVGDSMWLYYAPAPYYAYYGGGSDYRISSMRHFGDPIDLRTVGDAWGTLLSVGSGAQPASSSEGLSDYGGGSGHFVERSISGTGDPVRISLFPDGGATSGWSGENTAMGAFPNPIDGKLRMSRQMARMSQSDYTPRSILPGIELVPQSGLTSYASFQPRDTVPGPGSMSDRRLMYLWTGAGGKQGAFFIDITGPWR